MAVENRKVLYIKVLHSTVFIFMVVCLFYIVYCAISGTYNWELAVAMGTIFLEGAVLMLYRWQCPFTIWAERNGAKHGAVTDLFLPDWLAPHTFKIFGAIFAVSTVWLVIRYFLL
jgi:hypothetical protein